MVGQEAAQKGEMRLAPVRYALVVIAIRNRAADHQQQDLGQRMGDPPRFTRILDRAQMLEQHSQPGLRAKRNIGIGQVVGKRHRGGSEEGTPNRIRNCQTAIRPLT